MKKRKEWILLLAIISVVVGMGIFLPGPVGAGEVEPPPEAVDGSGNPVSTMHTLDEIYNKLLELVYLEFPARVEKTGQTTSYKSGDDGDEQAGVSFPIPRFKDNSNGTVTDNLTGLIWLKQANFNSTGGATGTALWNNAVDFCKALADGSCGLSDGSSAGDWRLPNIKEMQSLIHFGYDDPALPNTAGTAPWTSGDPFTDVQFGSNDYYWSATTYVSSTSSAWSVRMRDGLVNGSNKGTSYYVWPVRSGN